MDEEKEMTGYVEEKYCDRLHSEVERRLGVMEKCLDEKVEALNDRAIKNGKTAIASLVVMLVGLLGFFFSQIYLHVSQPNLDDKRLKMVLTEVIKEAHQAPPVQPGQAP